MISLSKNNCGDPIVDKVWRKVSRYVDAKVYDAVYKRVYDKVIAGIDNEVWNQSSRQIIIQIDSKIKYR